MLRSRIIPCLLIHNHGLIKTVRFADPKYVGDPINTVKIFNEKEADELVVLDIDATANNREPDYGLIEKLAVECRMPFCYGGGIREVHQATRIIQLGVEKVALSAASVERPELIAEIAGKIGKQSVVAVVDVKKSFPGNYSIYTHNGTRKAAHELVSFLKQLESLGVGEIIINSIDRDGTMEGYDTSLISIVRETVSVPITALGGAGKLEDLKELVQSYRIIGAAAGSIFVFKGVHKAVLVSYPSRSELLALYGKTRHTL